MRLSAPIRGARAGIVLLLLAALGGTACGGSNTSAPVGFTWQKVAPDAVGLDAARLQQIAARARSGKSNCLIVVRNGKIAGEWYFRGTDRNTAQEVFSVTKSVVSTLIGIARDDGLLSANDAASIWIPEWRVTGSRAVTIRNLLSNDSGREWSALIDYTRLPRAKNRTAFAIALKQAARRGTVWAYNNSAIQTLEQVLQEATGEDVAAFALDRLFEPLGMADTRMTRDRAGNTQVYQGLRSTCRDLARFGLLMLNGGRWDGEQVVAPAWVRAATGRPSTQLNAAYGYLWWLNREGILASSLSPTSLADARSPTTTRGRLVPGAPTDLYWALGLGNQVIQVDPGSKTVVVRLGTAEASPQPPTFGAAEASTVVTEALSR